MDKVDEICINPNVKIKGSDFVNVAVRIRPPLDKTISENALRVLYADPPVIEVADRNLSYSIDQVFDESSNQIKIYQDTVKPLVDRALLGYNCTVFAYGQTGSGKTYTMGSDPNNIDDEDSCGIILRALQDLLSRQNENNQVNVKISFYEIYNEKVYDLLTEDKNNLPVNGYQVKDMTMKSITYCSEAKLYLSKGGLNRHRGETKQNPLSSRSHAIFTIYVNVRNDNNETVAKLNLVDLAGSESVKKTGTEGSQFQEGVNINKGLLIIGQVIKALILNCVHVPYRDSMITTMLRDSLSKNNYITLIACVNSCIQDISETVQTLDFAQRTKKLKNRPELNVRNVQMQSLSVKKSQCTIKPTYQRANSLFVTPLKRRLPFSSSTVLRKVPSSPLVCSTFIGDNNVINPDIPDMMNMSGVSTCSKVDPIGLNMSPIINRCIDVIHDKIMMKLEGTITRLEKVMAPTPNAADISRMIREEALKVVASTNRAQSSPNGEINANDLFPERSSHSPILRQHPDNTIDYNFHNPLVAHNTHQHNDDEISVRDTTSTETLYNGVSRRIFKMPKPLPLPRKSKMVKNKRVEDLKKSPSPKERRSSLRLSLKACSVDSKHDYYSPKGEYCRRKSVRLSIKSKSVTFSKENEPKERYKVSPRPTPRLRKYSQDLDENPTLARHRHLLHDLNYGDLKDLIKLPTIGLKTAYQILCFRSIKSKFNKISDLESMVWKGTGYERFLQANYLEPSMI